MKSPKATKVCKYSGHGPYSGRSFQKYRLPTKVVSALVTAANHSLAQGTFKSYRTAERHIIRCEKEMKVKLRFPFGDREVLTYIGWLMTHRKVAVKTIEKYLAGIRLAHIKEGYNVPILRPDIVKVILTGLGQKENIEIRLGNKAERLPVTLSVLELIRHELKKESWSVEKKRLILTVCCMAFFGSFRIHELLAKEKMEFDQQTTLLGNNLTIENWKEKDSKVMKIWLKSPKELRKGSGVMVEIFSTNNHLCPIRAYEKWRSISKVAKTSMKPVFRKEDGTNYTGKEFNADLKKLLSKHLDYNKGKILSHSFRSGLATMMAQCGYSDEEIMRTGRWCNN